MRCFIHPEKEAISVCKNCGKAMCADCSAFSGHNGICPECRLEEFIQERGWKESELKSIKFAIFGWGFVGVITCWTIIGALIGGVLCYKKVKEKRECEKRIADLTLQIDRLSKALKNRGTAQFI